MMRSPWQIPRLAAALLCLTAAPLAAAGASAGPRLVRDLFRGTLLEPAQVRLDSLTTAGATTYFSAGDPVHGVELWASDGTAAGTRRVTDVCAGRCEGNPGPGPVVVADGRLFFTADDGFSGRELWTSAGTPGSERPVADLCPGACDASISPLAAAGGLVFFSAAAAGSRRLFRSDGTRAGTFALAALCRVGREGCEPYNSALMAFRERIFFEVQEPESAVWVSDGTAAGTRPAAGLFGPLDVVYARSLVPLDGIALVWAADGLWRTDATPAGTVRLRTAAELLADPRLFPSVYGQATWRGAVYFSLGSGELVRSDGTAAGTARIATFPDGRLGVDLTPTAGALVMRLYEVQSTFVRELWRSEGTPGSTGPLATPPAAGGLTALAAAGDRAVFLGLDEFSNPHFGSTDGTVGGTRALDLPGSADAYRLPSTGALALYTANTGIFPGGSEGYGLVLWRSDGTAAGSFALHDFETRPGSGGPLAQIELGGRLLFSGRTSFTDAPLFVSDGTDAGTRQISRDGSWALRFARLGAQAFFPAFDGSEIYGSALLESRGLYKSDGTAAGTGRVAPFTRFAGNATAVSGRLFFTGEMGFSFGGYSDFELFATDGRPGHVPFSMNINPYLYDIGHAHICVGDSSNPGPGVAVGGATSSPPTTAGMAASSG